MALTDTIRPRAKRPAKAAEPSVTIDEIAGVLGVSDGVVLEAAAGAGVDVAYDWADRAAVAPEGARALVQAVRSRPPAQPRSAPAGAGYGPPPVLDPRSGRYVNAISRPGDSEPAGFGGDL